jgi:hypothetical protein
MNPEPGNQNEPQQFLEFIGFSFGKIEKPGQSYPSFPGIELA